MKIKSFKVDKVIYNKFLEKIDCKYATIKLERKRLFRKPIVEEKKVYCELIFWHYLDSGNMVEREVQNQIEAWEKREQLNED